MILTVAERAEKALRDLDALDGNDHAESCASTRDACLDCGWEFDEHPVKLEHGRVCEELRAHECTCGLTDAISALRASHELQRARIERLSSALEWYADPRTWNQWLPDSAGDRARKALGREASNE